jgi:hypothetical protein
VRSLAAVARIIGFTSYLSFPANYRLTDERDYESFCVAWCHCFREPHIYFRSDRPLLLLSYSDFTDYSLVCPQRLFPAATPRKVFDFAYVCQSGPWKEHVKNWELAQRCLPVLCGQLKLTGVLVGRDPISNLERHGGRLTLCGELPWSRLMEVFACSRFLFVPNELDPSPRVITEALCMDIPVLVNRNILGGWNYVNPFTGAFFENESDVAAGARRCLETWTSPRRWFIANSGPLLAGRRLSRFLAEFDPAMVGVQRVQITDTVDIGST